MLILKILNIFILTIYLNDSVFAKYSCKNKTTGIHLCFLICVRVCVYTLNEVKGEQRCHYCTSPCLGCKSSIMINKSACPISRACRRVIQVCTDTHKDVDRYHWKGQCPWGSICQTPDSVWSDVLLDRYQKSQASLEQQAGVTFCNSTTGGEVKHTI